jgi:deoxycytidylate deaminase
MFKYKIMETLRGVAIATPRCAGVKVAACIVHKNRIISFGVARYKSNPFQLKFAKNPESIFFHAETAVIKNALGEVTVDVLRRSYLYVCRVRSFSSNFPNTWVYGNAKPCQGCMKAILEFQIKDVYYSENELIAKSLFKEEAFVLY